jgi:RHS repeat-associated protein
VKIGVQSYYNTNSITTTNSSFTDVLTSLANGLVNTTGGAHGNVSNLTTSGSSVYTGLTSFLGADDPAPPGGYPKAYLNWIFLDDQFNYVSSLSGAVPAASSTYPAGTLNVVAPGSQLIANKNGYLYVWVSNETQGWDVFFDNLSVQHRQGPVLEENHYYPFGLSMQGISDKALKTNYGENKYRFSGKELQNKEFSDGTGLEEYDFGARLQDPQLGVWHNLDPLAEKSRRWSPYNYAYNNPERFIDPDGMNPNESLANYVGGAEGLVGSPGYVSNVIAVINHNESVINNEAKDDDKSQQTDITSQNKNNGNKGGKDGDHDGGGKKKKGESGGETFEDLTRNPDQDKKLTPGDIDKLKEHGWDHSDKGDHGGQTDLYKDQKGNVYQKPKGGSGVMGEPIGINLNNLFTNTVKAAAAVTVGIAIWEGVKWIGAVILAPETGGASLVGAAALP